MLAAAIVSATHAGWVSGGKLNASPALLNEKFGIAAASDGDWLAVGASESTIGTARATGSVHIFRRDGTAWTYHQTLSAPRPATFQIFGCAVAMRGSTLVVGAWGSSGFAGRAFVFNLSSSNMWEHAATLEAADPQTSRPALFGWSVAIDTPAGAPPVIAVGRPNDGATSAGAVYVFERPEETWTQVAKLGVPSPATSEQVGANVSIRDGVIVSGSSRYRRAAVFRRTAGTWAWEATLTSTASAAGDGFGASVTSGGSFVAIGSPNRTRNGLSKAGAVTVFDRNADGTWNAGTELALDTPKAGDNFGFSLASATTGPSGAPVLLVGIPGFDAPLQDSGIGVTFQRQGTRWSRIETDLWSEAAVRGQFAGKSCTISSDGLLAVLSSELPRGSVGGAFPMAYSATSEGSGATRTDGSSGSGSGGGGGTGGGGSEDAGLDDAGGPDISGSMSGSIGSGGRPRSPKRLPPLVAEFGTVTDTIVVDTGDRQAVVGLQTDGVQEGSRVEVQVLATYPDTWTLAGLGDVNGDASGDLVWKDESGQMRVWLRDGTSYIAKNTLRALGARESVVACLDFDGDGIEDVVTQDAEDHEVRVIRMRDGRASVEYGFLLPGPGWNVVPHRLESGLLVRNASSGETRRVEIDSVFGDLTEVPSPSPEPAARIEGTGDIDGDGSVDMVTRNPGEDDLSIWRLDRNGELIESRELGIDGGRWKVEAVRDWDGNGSDDILVSEGGSGKLVVLYMHFDDGICKILKSRVIGSVGGARVVDVIDR